jgi:hypothetical protein
LRKSKIQDASETVSAIVTFQGSLRVNPDMKCIGTRILHGLKQI